jgi:NADPH-dependent 2,4-dienoyl-CoA reductase/sulfur reductase-like enzyme
VQTFQADLAVIGAGGAGLRAAIAAAQANPNAKIALISKVYPCAAIPLLQKEVPLPLRRIMTALSTIFTTRLPGRLALRAGCR